MVISLPQFPNSSAEPFFYTSPKTTSYNCIAWAFGDSSKWYWPEAGKQFFWTEEVPRQETISSFIQLYELIGYIQCDNGDLESGFEKVAIFADIVGKPTHAARQLESGVWTSKLGGYVDVSHSIFGISGGEYGHVAVFMKREES